MRASTETGLAFTLRILFIIFLSMGTLLTTAAWWMHLAGHATTVFHVTDSQRLELRPPGSGMLVVRQVVPRGQVRISVEGRWMKRNVLAAVAAVALFTVEVRAQEPIVVTHFVPRLPSSEVAVVDGTYVDLPGTTKDVTIPPHPALRRDAAVAATRMSVATGR